MRLARLFRCPATVLFLGLGFALPLARGQEAPPVDLTPQRVKIDGEEMFALGFDRLSSFA